MLISYSKHLKFMVSAKVGSSNYKKDLNLHVCGILCP